MAKPPVRSGAEQDVYSGWRQRLKWQPGQIAYVKRKTARRYRREAKRGIREGRDE